MSVPSAVAVRLASTAISSDVTSASWIPDGAFQLSQLSNVNCCQT